MAGETHAGSIFVELKTKYESAVAGMNKAKVAVEQVGASVQKTSQAVAAGGLGIARGLDAADKAAIRLSAKLARVTGIMFSLQAVMSSFSGNSGGASKFTAAMQGASTGLGTFAAIALALPGPLGVALGAVTGLTAGAVGFAKAMGDNLKAVEAIQAVVNRIDNRRIGTAGQKGFNSATMSGSDASIANLKADIELRKQELEDVFRAQEELSRRIQQQRAIFEGSASPLDRANAEQWLTINDNPESAQRRAAATAQAADRLKGGQAELALAEAMRARQELETDNKRSIDNANIMLQNGLIQPLDLLSDQARAAQEQLQKLFNQQGDLNKIKPGLGNTLNTDVSQAIQNAQTTQDALRSQQQLQQVAVGFGNAIGSAVYDGVLQGKKAMEIVAAVGKNLFANFINDAVKNLQDGMTAAFKYAFGAAGGAVGGVVSAALGVAGAIYASRQNESDDAFDSVQSAIESSQAVRGIVAGPSSVAIASVGENIQRAFEPSRQLLQSMLGVLREINAKSGRGGGAQGTPYPSVATS